MNKKYLNQIKAFILSHQTGYDPDGYLTRLKQIYSMRLEDWDGKLPTNSQFKPALDQCKVVESTPKKSIIPWWWYMDQGEPVPTVVQGIYKHIVFDYVIIYPKKNIWIYIIIEPGEKELKLLNDQANLRAFIMISLINKNFNPRERQFQRLRLGKVLNSKEVKKILTFISLSQNYELKDNIPNHIPTLSSITDARCTNWRINYPGEKQTLSNFKELVDILF